MCSLVTNVSRPVGYDPFISGLNLLHKNVKFWCLPSFIINKITKINVVLKHQGDRSICFNTYNCNAIGRDLFCPISSLLFAYWGCSRLSSHKICQTLTFLCNGLNPLMKRSYPKRLETFLGLAFFLLDSKLSEAYSGLWWCGLMKWTIGSSWKNLESIFHLALYHI